METHPNRVIRALLIVAGTVSLALGIIGIALPLLPTTPFLLLAAACYARSSERFYNWLITNRLFGEYLRSYKEGRGFPWKVKTGTIAFLWAMLVISMLIVVTELWQVMLLSAVGLVVSIHIATLGRNRERHHK